MALSAADVDVITLSGLIVMAKHAFSARNESQTIFVTL